MGDDQFALRDTKSEIRNPKSETNSNERMKEIQNGLSASTSVPVSPFPFLNFSLCFGFRVSDFGFSV